MECRYQLYVVTDITAMDHRHPMISETSWILSVCQHRVIITVNRDFSITLFSIVKVVSYMMFKKIMIDFKNCTQ